VNGSTRWQKIALNTIAISGGEVANKASTFLVYAAVSRAVGLESFGQLALGLTLLYTCHVLGVAGLPTTLTRLVAKRPVFAKNLLRLGYLAGIFSSTSAAIIMVMAAQVLQYQPTTTHVINVLALAVPFYSLTMVTEAVIRGREKMHLIALGNLPGNLLLVLGSWFALWLGLGVVAVAWVVVLSRGITAATLHGLAVWSLRHEAAAGPCRISLAWRLLVRSRVFLWSDSVAAIGASFFAVILSKFTSETEVGMLNAAFQLMQPVQILYRSVGHSAFPPLVAAAKLHRKAVTDLVHAVLSLVIRLAYPATLVMFVMAADVLDLVYGARGFKDGAFVLQILAFGLLCDPLNPVLGHALWAVGADRVVFRIVIANVSLTVLLGLLLIGTSGLWGAAVCSLICCLVNTALHYWAFTIRVGEAHLLREFAKLSPAIFVSLAVVIWSPWSPVIGLVVGLFAYALVAGLLWLQLGNFQPPRTAGPSPKASEWN
jgi:O-antigen/teichoic acid export membrane protein